MLIFKKFTVTRTLSIVGLFILSTVECAYVASAQDFPDAMELVENVNARDEGVSQTRKIKMELTNKKGKTRTRETDSYRRYFGKEKRTILFYNTPTNVKDTGFLTFDYPEADKDDDQWLYLPALRKVRRISASDRGDYFLGTDFSYEDIKKENKVEAADYTFKTIGSDDIDGHQTWVVEATPRTAKIAKELGYSRTNLYVDPKLWISRKGEFWDVNGNHLKTAEFSDVEVIQGIVTAKKIKVKNHKTGHSTVFTFSDIDYETEVDEALFAKNALKRR